MTNKQFSDCNKVFVDVINQDHLTTMYSYRGFSKPIKSFITQTTFLSSFKNYPSVKNTANIFTHGKNLQNVKQKWDKKKPMIRHEPGMKEGREEEEYEEFDMGTETWRITKSHFRNSGEGLMKLPEEKKSITSYINFYIHWTRSRILWRIFKEDKCV